MTDFTKDDVLSYSEANDVRFVRLSFCDIFGQLKNVSIAASELGRAFEEGIRFDASAIRGFLNIEDSDLLLFPEPNTLSSLSPYEGAEGKTIRLFCSILHPDMKPFEGDARYLLKSKEQSLLKKDLNMAAGTECEFYLFRLDEEGNPTLNPMDNAGYLDPSPMDKAENLRARLSQIMRGMGITIETSHHEKGPGQNEVSFAPTSLLEAADDIISFKAALKNLAALSSLYASFLPKPLFDKPGSGFHISLSCRRGNESFDTVREHMAAGILNRIKELTLFLNPIANSYDRLGLMEAPSAISWGTGNRDLLLRMPEMRKGGAKRIEVRSADPSSNPYLALYLLVSAAEEGIERKMKLDEIPENGKLPENLREAVEEAEASAFVKSLLPEHLRSCFIEAKKTDWKNISASGYPKVTARDTEFPLT